MYKIYILADRKDFLLFGQLTMALSQVEGVRIISDSNFVCQDKNYGFSFGQDFHERFVYVELSTHESHEDLCAISWQIYGFLAHAKIEEERLRLGRLNRKSHPKTLSIPS